MAFLALRSHTRLASWLVVASALAAVQVFAQEPETRSVEEEPPEIRAIPLEQLAERAERLAAELQAMIPSDAAPHSTASICRRLGVWTRLVLLG